MSAPIPITSSQWRRAYLDGATPRALLNALLDRLVTRGADAAWIRLASPGELAAQLDALDARALASGRAALPLYGVPFAVKDNIDIAGLPTTAACPAWSRVAERSAHAVERLVAAGAVWLGKTNLDQFATGLVGTRSPYGRPASVFAAERISGGSSSGSAVVVARGDVPFSLGTDTAGSGRVPAGFNQLVGLKPTPGRVSVAGVLPACRTLDCVSVFAHTVDDAAGVLALIEGPDARDAYSAFAPGPARWPARLRVGVPAAPVFLDDAGDGDGSGADGYRSAYAAAVDALRAQGHAPLAIDFEPLQAVAALLYDGPWIAERQAVVAELLASDPGALDPTVRQVIEAAHRHDAADAFRGLYRLRAAQRDSAAIWQRVDVLMVPTAPGHPRFADIDADPLGANAALGAYTNFVNLLGWCALALPAGTTAAGLPFGVTFIAPGNHDAALARFGAGWQRTLDLPLAPRAAGRAAALAMPIAQAQTSPQAAHQTVRQAATAVLRLRDLPDVDGPAAATPATEPVLPIAVVGAHLSGLPLNAHLTERGATLIEATATAPRYRLHALPGTTPPKPGLSRCAGDAGDGRAIALEVWALPQREVGSFLALIPAPLGLGSVELADGRWVHGFLCEAHALHDAPDVSVFGGWRAYLASIASPGSPDSPASPVPVLPAALEEPT